MRQQANSPEGTGGCKSITELPHECCNIILQHLSTRDLCMMSRTSKGLRELCIQDDVWARCYTKLYGDWLP